MGVSMAIYEWTDRLSVGDETIDRQHKILISYINSIAETVEQKGGQGTEIALLLNNLIMYTKMHFIYEEILFSRSKYPELETHKQFHKNLVAQVEAFQQRFKSGDASLGPELLAFLMDWLNTHIMKSDIAYVEFAKSQSPGSTKTNN